MVVQASRSSGKLTIEWIFCIFSSESILRQAVFLAGETQLDITVHLTWFNRSYSVDDHSDVTDLDRLFRDTGVVIVRQPVDCLQGIERCQEST